MFDRQLCSRPLPAELELDKNEFLALLNLVRAAKEGKVGPVDAAVQLRPVVGGELCPLVADVFSMTEHFDGRLEDIACCYLGDGRAQVAGRLLLVGAMLGMDVRIAAPRQFWPADALIDAAEDLAAESGARLLVTSDAGHAVLGADFLYTDAWTRSPETPEFRANRLEQLQPFRVTTDLLASTGKPTTKFLHRLPWRLGTAVDTLGWSGDIDSAECSEVTADVLGSAACLIAEQAENWLQATQAFVAARFPDLPRPRTVVCAGSGLRLAMHR